MVKKSETQDTKAKAPSLAKEVIATLKQENPEVIVVPGKLTDVNEHSDLFQDKTPGVYILQYELITPSQHVVQPVRVFWDGESLLV